METEDRTGWEQLERSRIRVPLAGHRFKVSAPHYFKEYARDVLEVHQFSDFINRDTNWPFTWEDWRDFVEKIARGKV